MNNGEGATTSATEFLSHETRDRRQIIKGPETRPMSSDQLIAEVKGIYAGFIMVEAKDCEADARQHQAVLETDTNIPTRNGEQWYAPIPTGNVKA